MCAGRPLFTLKQVQSSSRNLVIYRGCVLDVSRLAATHPGGPLVLKHSKGRDVSDEILAFHPQEVLEKRVYGYCVGYLEDYVPSKDSQAYFQLHQKLNAAGLFETKWSFYAKEMAKVLFLWATAVLLVLNASHWSTFILGAFVQAVTWHQAAFIAHDAGHNGITHIKRLDEWIGMSVANLLGGLSIGWWKRSHNVHHVFTNHPEHDPDIQHLPFFAISEMFFDNLYSTYYGRIMAFDLASKWLISFQHLTFYIILAFGRFYLYVQSIQYYMLHSATSSIVRHEMVLNVLYWVWYLALLSHVPTWPLRIAFVLVSHLSTALLHIQITLSHYSRDVDRIPIHESFASMTFRTTLDVDCLSQLDWLHGGLQFQVAHHLFPRAPRHHLREISVQVAEMAQKLGHEYHIYDFFSGNVETVRSLRRIALIVSKSMFQ